MIKITPHHRHLEKPSSTEVKDKKEENEKQRETIR